MDTEDFNADAPEEQVPVAPTQSTTLQTLTTEQSVLEEMPEVVVPEKKPPTTPLQDSLRKLRRDKRAMVSVGIILFFLILPIIGPFIYQHIGGPIDSTTGGTINATVYHNPFHQELGSQYEGPSATYWLGTDAIGRDLLARLMQGLLISIAVAIAVEVIDVVMGVTIGVLAGYFGGWIDQVLARLTDVMFAFPGLLFAILLSGVLGAQADNIFGKIPLIGANGNARLILISMALAMTSWPLMARYVRGQTLQLKQQQFVEAARTTGSSNATIIMRHIIPNLFSIVVVAATLDIAGTIIGEASLSFLGLGVQPPGSSIGLMINDALNVAETNPWQVLLPALVLATIVVAFSFLGDGLRDAFDPRSKD